MKSQSITSRALPLAAGHFDFSVRPGLQDRLWRFLLKRLLTGIRGGMLSISLPSGARLSFGEPGFEPIAVAIHSPALFLQLLSGNPLALAEGNLRGHWSCNDQVALFVLLQRNQDVLQQVLRSGWWTKMRARFQHKARANTRSGSRRNIAFHYDLGNDFYDLWLDETMTYSSAYKLAGQRPQDLVAAQKRKYARVLELMGLEGPGSLLEIGCGWGGMALAAAARGHSVSGVTLSREQLAYAEDKVAEEGFSDQVDLRLMDYRDVSGQYDGLMSIEMIEAVGEEHWPQYFAKIEESLKPGGRAVLQAITMADDYFERYRSNVDFIQHYIFPGGFLPSPSALEYQANSQGLVLKKVEYFGKDYARTLAMWRKEFLAKWDQIAPLGFDERFKRMWLYYLDYCEAGFLEGSIDVGFFVLEKPAASS